jgi:hypothetical protein
MSIPPSNDSNPIDRDFVILPSSIFEKKNWKDKEEEEGGHFFRLAASTLETRSGLKLCIVNHHAALLI